MHAAWAALPDARREKWEADASAAKAALHAEKRVSIVGRRQEQVAAQPAAPGRPAIMSTVQEPVDDARSVQPVLVGTMEPYVANQQVLPQCLQGADGPLHVSVLNQALACKSIMGLHRAFETKTDHIELPKPGDFRRPTPYEARCQGLCTHTMSPHGDASKVVLQMQECILAFLVTHAGSTHMSDDILLVFRVEDVILGVRVEFYALLAEVSWHTQTPYRLEWLNMSSGGCGSVVGHRGRSSSSSTCSSRSRAYMLYSPGLGPSWTIRVLAAAPHVPSTSIPSQ